MSDLENCRKWFGHALYCLELARQKIEDEPDCLSIERLKVAAYRVKLAHKAFKAAEAEVHLAEAMAD